jgi:single-stranded-DNA-specific exonuclease
MERAVIPEARRLFLDVRKSATGLAWEHRLSARQENIALAIAQGTGIPEITARVLAGREVLPESAERFLDPTIRDLLPDPARLTDMDAAASRLADAISRREKVAIFGDYDVDGAASSAMLKRFLAHYGVEAEIYIPDRIFEGYGPNPDAMRELARRGATLIVTVDCGTNSGPAIAAANEAGAQVVVLDHHQVGGPLPPALATVNPNREDDLSGQGHLCAAGVVFLALVRTAGVLRERGFAAKAPDLLGYLDLAALATVADVVPLVGVNRAFVAKGLLAMRRRENAGIAALAELCKIGEPMGTFHLSFLIGPRINAGGRIGDAALGARLLSTDDAEEARAIAEQLHRLNEERQAMEAEMLAAARAEADAELVTGGPAVLVTASEGWHPGIVGLIAARLKEHARRPAFAIALGANGIGTGSGRSIPGFDLGRLVRDAFAKGLLVKGGGHAMAAGISVERAKLGALRAFFEERASDAVVALRDAEVLHIDAAVSAEGATLALCDTLEKAGPYGSGHPAPVFALPRHRIADAREVGNGHVRLDLQSLSGARLSAIAFRAAQSDLGSFLFARRGSSVHLAGTLSVNHWNGRETVQMRVTDAAAEA